MRLMYTAFLFDLDGTLLDSEVLWVQATGLAIGESGYSLPEDELTTYVYGRAWRDIYAELASRFGDNFPPYPELTATARRYFDALHATTDIRIHSSIELFQQLAAAYPVAVVSGSRCEDIAENLQRFELLPLVRFFLGSEDYAPGKPDPACYRLAAERLGVPPAQCLVFEDSAAGVRAAKAAGMACVALRRPGGPAQDLSPADWIVADLHECLQQGMLPIR